MLKHAQARREWQFEPGLVLQILEAPPVTRIGGAFLCGSVEDARGGLPLITTLLFR